MCRPDSAGFVPRVGIRLDKVLANATELSVPLTPLFAFFACDALNPFEIPLPAPLPVHWARAGHQPPHTLRLRAQWLNPALNVRFL